ncbi:hypothetical protein [Gilliamella sp. Imp1-1]|nr:hypothetical protein [Gilliamella apicola]KDN09300.1 hypothetical protein GAPWKB30_2098 [Gilliamella apicola]
MSLCFVRDANLSGTTWHFLAKQIGLKKANIITIRVNHTDG